MQFETKVLDLIEQELWGLQVKTNMELAPEDCPKLWEEFLNYLTILNENKIELVTSYGVSVPDDDGSDNFTYWAVAPKTGYLKLDENAQKIILSKGLYLSVKVDLLENLPLAYKYAYEVWPQENETYRLDYSRSSAELYEAAYTQTGEFFLLIPINE